MILFRTRDMVLIGLMLGLAAFTYKVKYEAQKSHAHIRQLERQIEAEIDTINLLKAEWALLSEPRRIARLAGHYAEELELQTIDPIRIVNRHELPQRLPDAIDLLITEHGSDDDLSLDLLRTGSVTP